MVKLKSSKRILYLHYFLSISVLFAFLCPLFKCNDIGQKIYSKIKSILLKLDFGIGEYINQKKRERSGRSSLNISSTCEMRLSLSGTVRANPQSVIGVIFSYIGFLLFSNIQLSKLTIKIFTVHVPNNQEGMERFLESEVGGDSCTTLSAGNDTAAVNSERGTLHKKYSISSWKGWARELPRLTAAAGRTSLSSVV